jgi:hypothetical protein
VAGHTLARPQSLRRRILARAIPTSARFVEDGVKQAKPFDRRIITIVFFGAISTSSPKAWTVAFPAARFGPAGRMRR